MRNEPERRQEEPRSNNPHYQIEAVWVNGFIANHAATPDKDGHTCFWCKAEITKHLTLVVMKDGIRTVVPNQPVRLFRRPLPKTAAV